MSSTKLIYRVHALRRMFERSIRPEQVEHILAEGDVIEEYADDIPLPSKLMMGIVDGRPLHVVAADDVRASQVVVITVYEPDPGQRRME